MEKEKNRIFVDMDGVIAGFPEGMNVKDMYEKGYFKNLPPMQWTIYILWLLQCLLSEKIELYVLSAVLPTSYAIKEKDEWLDKYFPMIPKEKRIWVKNGDNKADYVPGGIRNSDILLDDYSHNLHRFVASGGKGIKLFNGKNGTKGTWKGPAISYEEKPKKVLSIFQKVIEEE